MSNKDYSLLVLEPFPRPKDFIQNEKNVIFQVEGSEKAFEKLESQGISWDGFFLIKHAFFPENLVTRIVKVNGDGTCDLTAFLVDNPLNLQMFSNDEIKEYVHLLYLPLVTELPKRITNIEIENLIEQDPSPSNVLFTARQMII